MIADGTRMKQMESQLQQVMMKMVEMQNRMEALENFVERRIEGAMNVWRKESRSQTVRLEDQMREQGQALKDQMQQFVLMLSHQT